MKKGKWLEGKVQCWFNEQGERVSTTISTDSVVLKEINIAIQED